MDRKKKKKYNKKPQKDYLEYGGLDVTEINIYCGNKQPSNNNVIKEESEEEQRKTMLSIMRKLGV